jgi:hypothetical protein
MIAYRELAAGMPLHTRITLGVRIWYVLMDSALIQTEYADFVLEESAPSVWILVDNISVYVRRSTSGEAVAVDMYPLGMEMDDPICGTWSTFQEAEERIKDNEDEFGTDDNGPGERGNSKDARPASQTGNEK